LWDYSFKVNITNVGYLVLPIGTLASDYAGVCRIFVSYELYQLDDSPMIPTIGTMIFQSIFYEQNQNILTLSANTNTFGTVFEPYINTTWSFGEGPNAFLPTRIWANVDPTNHMVVVEQSILGMPASKFLLDANCTYPYFWTSECTQNLSGSDANCSAAPTYTPSEINTTDLSQYEYLPNQDFRLMSGGFWGEAKVYNGTNTLTLNDGSSLDLWRVKNLGVHTIVEDTWLYGLEPQTGAVCFGTFGQTLIRILVDEVNPESES
jgi:hypothetical protein